MPERCDACGKRRATTMHPIGMDLCRECAAFASAQDHTNGGSDA